MSYENSAIFWIEVENVVPNPYQPRKEFDEAKLQELADSIRMYGVLQPLVATRKEVMREDGTFTTMYELIAGERRLRASKKAGLAQVPVIVRSGEESELMKLELAIIENLQREDLNAVDRALAFKQLADQFKLSHTQVAKKVGRSREYVSNSIRLLGLPATILDALKVGDISDGHARTLLMLNDKPEEQDVVFREILMKKLSVREVERISRKIATDKVRKRDWLDTDPELIAIEKQFTETLGTRVQIQKTEFGGKLTIDYFSQNDLNKLLELMHKEREENESDEAILAHLTRATPLSPSVTENIVPVKEPEEVKEAYDGEAMFTRHDSLETVVSEEKQEEALTGTSDEGSLKNEQMIRHVPIENGEKSIVEEKELVEPYDLKTTIEHTTVTKNSPHEAISMEKVEERLVDQIARDENSRVTPQIIMSEPQREIRNVSVRRGPAFGFSRARSLEPRRNAGREQSLPQAPLSKDEHTITSHSMNSHQAAFIPRRDAFTPTILKDEKMQKVSDDSAPILRHSPDSKTTPLSADHHEDESDLYSIKDFTL